MSTTTEPTKKARFAPKEPVELAPPRDDIVSLQYLSKCTGKNEGYPTLVAILGVIYDVSKNEVYAPGKGYNVFTGRDASRALAKSSLEDADCVDDIDGLTEEELTTLKDWNTFFSYRYNVVGRVEGSRHIQ